MLVDIYCDESRQDLLVKQDSLSQFNRYACIGGVWVPTGKREELKSDIKNLKNEYGIRGEFKWGNVSNNKIDFYKALISLFFAHNDVMFRCVVIDASEVDNKKYNESDQELGYYKFYYQLLHNWLDSKNDYYVFTDFKTNKERDRLHELQRITNLGLYGGRIKILQAIDSKESLILQMQNILMGTVAYKFNYRDMGQSIAKNELVNEVESYIGRPIEPVYRNEQKKFDIFKISLRGGRQ